MAIEYAIQAHPFVLYDGTNSADVLAATAAFLSDSPFIASETGGVLRIGSGSTINDPVSVSAGDRVDIRNWSRVSAAQWAAQYIAKA